MALALAIPSDAEEGKVGTVLLHGKQDKAPYHIGSLAQKLRGAGRLVATPEMPWSRNRIYDASYEDALLEIDKAVEALKKDGARKVLVGGLSLGGNVAVGYASRRDNLVGIIVLAPGHFPELQRPREIFAPSVARAKGMVAAGRGDSTDSFSDFNMGKTFNSRASAKNYLSYFDPDGPAVVPTNATAIRSPIPILWVVGTKDPLTRPSSYAFDKAPPHPKSKYLVVDASHLETPIAAAEQVLSWLRSLD
jgi:pimeloyl-ACP methyl ester carboxylesterase